VHEGSSHKFNTEETADLEQECREILEESARQADREQEDIRRKIEVSMSRDPTVKKKKFLPAASEFLPPPRGDEA